MPPADRVPGRGRRFTMTKPHLLSLCLCVCLLGACLAGPTPTAALPSPSAPTTSTGVQSLQTPQGLTLNAPTTSALPSDSYQDPSLSPERRADALLRQMTLAEKVGQMT